MKIRTAIVDDDMSLLKALEKELQSFEYIDLIYQTDDSQDFLEYVLEEKPDLVLMDIDMPVYDGIALGAILRKEMPFLEIVYITAHDEYIKDAVKLYASDFIEKPYSRSRLNNTLSRIANKLSVSEKFYEIKVQKSIKHIHLSELICIEVSNRKSIIHTETKTYPTDYTLKELEAIFDSPALYRSSRSYLVNLYKIDAIEKYSRTSYAISFVKTKVKAYLSKVQYDEFRQLIKKIN